MKTIRLFFLIILVAFYISHLSAQTDAAKLLDDAYKLKSVEKLNAFLELWKADTKPISDTELSELNDTIQCAYKAMSAFYNSDKKFFVSNKKFVLLKKTTRIETADFESYQLLDTNYVIEESFNRNKIDTSSIDNFRKKFKNPNGSWNAVAYENFYNPNQILDNEKLYSILNDFRPNLKTQKIYYLFKNDHYEKIIDSFLLNKTPRPRLTQYAIKHPKKGKREKRKDFLMNSLFISEGNSLDAFGYHYYFSSNPSVGTILLNESLNCAYITYDIETSSYEAILVLQNNEWVLKHNVRTRVE